MDFRDPNIAGTFVYHGHVLDHEDAGMMAKIRALGDAERFHCGKQVASYLGLAHSRRYGSRGSRRSRAHR
jgi:hypothetical protein